MITVVKIGGGGKQMYLRHRPFRWPWWCAHAKQSALPDAAQPGLHRKPLDVVIGRLLAPFHLSSRQGDNQHIDDAKYSYFVLMAIAMCTHFAGRFDGHHDAAVLYRAHRPVEEVRGFHKSH